ncbi:MAG: glycosyltransferase family 4 protein [Proteobacteria bacterium]|nr:glycosyltransferase family 4 protein [Pseudomonadota bacterium]
MATLPPNFTLLQVVPSLETGGAEQSTLDVAAAVVRDGGRAIVASCGGRMVKLLKASGAEFVPMPVQTKNPLLGVVNAFRLAALIRREKVGVIHVRSRAPAFSALWASKMTGVPMVATYHGAYPAKSGLKRWYNSVMTKGAVVIANSAFTRDHLLAQHAVDPEKVVTIPRGLSLNRFDPAAVPSARTAELRAVWGVAEGDRRVRILLPGRLTRLKGQLVLIEAAARLYAQGRRDFLILLVGDDQGRGAYRAEVQDAIAQAGLSGAVRLLGHCDDMPAAYLAADIVAVPSTVPETFGRTAVEAQAMGRPVIASALGGLTETVVPGESGWLAPARDVDAWTQALQVALDAGSERRAAMGQAGQARVRRLYALETMTNSTLAVYARVLQGKA